VVMSRRGHGGIILAGRMERQDSSDGRTGATVAGRLKPWPGEIDRSFEGPVAPKTERTFCDFISIRNWWVLCFHGVTAISNRFDFD
jgi:hypothetical protein